MCVARALHETLMQRILEEEEELISAHRTQIESNMALVRDEMNLLGEVRVIKPLRLLRHESPLRA